MKPTPPPGPRPQGRPAASPRSLPPVLNPPGSPAWQEAAALPFGNPQLRHGQIVPLRLAPRILPDDDDERGALRVPQTLPDDEDERRALRVPQTLPDDEEEAPRAELTLILGDQDPQDFKIEVSWEIKNGPVKNLTIHWVGESALTETKVKFFYVVPDEDANKPLGQIQPAGVPFYMNLTVALTADNADPPAPSAILKPETKALHLLGANIKQILGTKILIPIVEGNKIPIPFVDDKGKRDERSKQQKAEDLLALNAQKQLGIDVFPLVQWAVQQLFPDKEAAGHSRWYETVLQASNEVLLEAIDEATSWAVGEMPNFIADMIPFIGQIKAGGTGAWKLYKAGSKGWAQRNLYKAEALLVQCRAKPPEGANPQQPDFPRRQTPERLAENLAAYYNSTSRSS